MFTIASVKKKKKRKKESYCLLSNLLSLTQFKCHLEITLVQRVVTQCFPALMMLQQSVVN